MSPRTTIRTWLATADAAPARLARSALRSANRWRARGRSGSVRAEMDRIVADATDNTLGSGLATSIETRRRSWRARLRGEPAAGKTRSEGNPLR